MARAVGKVVNDDRADWRAAWALFPGSVAYIWHAGTKAGNVQDSLAACGFETRSQIIWAKNNFAIGRGHYHCKHEPCWLDGCFRNPGLLLQPRPFHPLPFIFIVGHRHLPLLIVLMMMLTRARYVRERLLNGHHLRYGRFYHCSNAMCKRENTEYERIMESPT
jgi:hypothetical protein